jgi:hypothetical protein
MVEQGKHYLFVTEPRHTRITCTGKIIEVAKQKNCNEQNILKESCQDIIEIIGHTELQTTISHYHV